MGRNPHHLTVGKPERIAKIQAYKRGRLIRREFMEWLKDKNPAELLRTKGYAVSASVELEMKDVGYEIETLPRVRYKHILETSDNFERLVILFGAKKYKKRHRIKNDKKRTTTRKRKVKGADIVS